jgi:RND family efflux transporter MFP subunit
VALLSAAVEGLVTDVRVDVGDRVGRGDVLAALDVELAQIELRAARAAARQTAEELRDAERRLEEARSLVADRIFPESEVEALVAEVAVDAAALERLQAEADRRAALVERHRIRAPFPGVISRKLIEAGGWLAPGTEAFELVATDDLRLDFQVAQEYLSRVDAGTAVRVSVGAGSESASGRVLAVVPVTDPTARTFLVRVVVDDGALDLTPGMSARATLTLDTGRNGVLVPRDALLRFPDGRVTVWVVETVDGSPRVAERQVELGVVSGGRVEIRSGIRPGTRVVVRGNEALQEGQRVRITEPTGS